jgi:hypothetical protein
MGALPLDLALSAVLAARLDGAARPVLLAAVARVPVPRTAADGAAPPAQPVAGRRS